MLQNKIIFGTTIVLLALLSLFLVDVKAEIQCNSDLDCESAEFCEFKNCPTEYEMGTCVRKPDSNSCNIPEFAVTGLICGCDSITYQNDCYRQAAGVSKNYKGECIEQISSHYCDSQHLSCPGDLECIKFPDIGTRCAEPDPCNYFDCSKISENSVCVDNEPFFHVPREVTCEGNCRSDSDCAGNEFCDYYPCDFGAGTCKQILKICPSTISSVCGCDGVTYDNDCIRKKAQIFKNYDGPCIKEISNVSCDVSDYGKDTCNFIGSCVEFPGIGRRCAVVKNFDYWPCPEGFELFVYPMYPFKIVCKKSCVSNDECGSTDYVEYDCFLHEKCEEVVTSEGCCEGISGNCVVRQSPCPDYYKPVCGCDGFTYKNNCFLMEADAVKKYDSECKWGVDITNINCDALNPCPEGLDLSCYSFPGLGLRCAKKDPCSYYECPEGTECGLTASYPGQVICSGKCEGEYCETGVSYNVLTGEVKFMKDNKPQFEEITLYSAGNKGVLETTFTSVKYSKELIIEGSELFMRTSVGKEPINVLPKDAISASETPEAESIKEIELKEEAQKPIYSVKGAKQVRILFIFPVTFEIETKVSAETGQVISVKKPWWSFLAW